MTTKARLHCTILHSVAEEVCSAARLKPHDLWWKTSMRPTARFCFTRSRLRVLLPSAPYTSATAYYDGRRYFDQAVDISIDIIGCLNGGTVLLSDLIDGVGVAWERRYRFPFRSHQLGWDCVELTDGRASKQVRCFDRKVDISIDIIDRLNDAIVSFSHLIDRSGCCVIMMAIGKSLRHSISIDIIDRLSGESRPDISCRRYCTSFGRWYQFSLRLNRTGWVLEDRSHIQYRSILSIDWAELSFL